MPCVSRFYGIAIYIDHGDHNGPHLHAIYGGNEALVDIQTGDRLIGG